MHIQRPTRNCTHPGCKQTQHPGASRCTTHHHAHQQQEQQRLHQTQTTTERKRKYNKGWQAQRQRIINRDQACAYCGTTTQLEVHHLTNNPTPTDRELITLCRRHHRAIEAETKRKTTGKVTTRVNQWLAGQ